MQIVTERQAHIQWHGMDASGHFRGTFRAAGRVLSLAIAIPRTGNPPHPGPLFNVLIDGQKMGSMPDLKSAQALAELHLLTPKHRQVDKTVIAKLGFLDRRRRGRS